MHRVNVLSCSHTPNSWAFNYPLKVNLHRLRDRGIQLEFHSLDSAARTDCQTIFVNSRLLSQLLGEREQQLFEALTQLGAQNARVFWFDTSDSTWIYQGAVLPYVDRFY